MKERTDKGEKLLSNLDERFIGRGERLVKKLLVNPFGIKMIIPQVPIITLISLEEYKFFDREVRQHKFDFVIYLNNGKKIAAEINYKHGAKADYKSNNIFKPVLKNNGIALLTIDDHSCRTLFNQNGKGIHPTTTDDVRDILDAFDVSGITL